jgi:uncharacterized membrane protein YqaE (UPF0057 family)
MLYCLAIFCPPVAVSLCRPRGRVLVNSLLTTCLWVPGVVHACLSVREAALRRRAERWADAIHAREEQLGRERHPRRHERRGAYRAATAVVKP